ncbi:hypothetical protein HMPREF1075_01168 [Parabacteroides distasonis CL03T12C09]|nr:hypothetical protein HMPREF1075_01168 [Parabacteroides distasonis CL03T12C09]CDB50238.1 unknown [Parabacteroides sp. CAG:2]
MLLVYLFFCVAVLINTQLCSDVFLQRCCMMCVKRLINTWI